MKSFQCKKLLLAAVVAFCAGTALHAQNATDPPGTVALRLSDKNTGETSFYPSHTIKDAILLTPTFNFTSTNGGWEFVSVGERKGLAYIQAIPETGWAKSIGVAPRRGYVARIRQGGSSLGPNYEYTGIYCDRWITAVTHGGIIGAEIKYVYPFSPRIKAVASEVFEYGPPVSDPQLAAWYLAEADTNRDGLLSEEERQAVRKLGYSAYGYNISTLEYLDYFPNLEKLMISISDFSSMSSLELYHDNLKELKTSFVNIDRMDLSGCPNLQIIKAAGCNLKNIVLPASAVEIDCSRNMLTQLDLSRCKNLQMLIVSMNRLQTVSVEGLPELVALYCGGNYLISLDVSKNKKLKTLYCSQNKFTELDISQNPNIEWLGITARTPKDLLTTLYIPISKTKRDYKSSSDALTWFTGVNVINK